MNKIIQFYKIPLLISFTTAVVLIALTTERMPINIALMFLISILSIIIVDLDYFFHSYLFDQDQDFAKNFKAYIKDKDFIGAITYANINEDIIKEKTIHSALFQSLFALFTTFIAFSDSSIIYKTAAISIYANLIYKYIEYSYTKNIRNWFWAFKIENIKEVSVFYLAGLILVLILCLLFV